MAHKAIVAANNFKTVLLLGGLMGLFLVVGSLWGTQGLIMGLVFGGLMNFVAFWFSDTIAIKSMRGQEVTREQAGWLYDMVAELAQRAELPMPRVYICPHAAPNAFATGRSPKKAAVAFTQGLLQSMTRDEIRGVAAHELAHIKNRDTLTSTIAATVSGVLAFLAQWGLLLGGGRREGGNPLVMIGVVILAAVGAALIKAMISRSRELVADADAPPIAGSPEGLMSALAKLDSMSRRVPLDQPNPAMNNLFIIEPLASNLGGGGTLINMFATHPPTEKRIASLRRLRG
ncbi:M48 family metalloprotease [Nodularia spumigena]|uniref:M48 family metalloprotease n=1 Tax=Nodularia spumigena TaxID=70799 RepID=UPI002B1F6919|nr:M48 family metalloprotease [Nodularia spumigena]MEA5611824.1 M48 family metalloprotease [Nodularia spumigena UHCC 0040]